MNAWLECRLWCAGWSKALMKVWWTCQRPIFLQPHHPSCVILAAVYLDIDTINKIWCSPQKEIISYQNDNFINWLGAQSNTSLHLVKRVTNFGPLPHFMDNIRSIWPSQIQYVFPGYVTRTTKNLMAMYQWIYFYQQVGTAPGTTHPPGGVSELLDDEDDENHNVTPHYLGGSVNQKTSQTH